MSKRPPSVTIISWIFIAFCGIVLLTRLLPLADAATGQRIAESSSQHPFQHALGYVGPVLAVVGGVFMLRGCNWARWLLVLWMGFHIMIGVLQSPLSSVVHSFLFAAIVYFLFRRAAAEYFRGPTAKER